MAEQQGTTIQIGGGWVTALSEAAKQFGVQTVMMFAMLWFFVSSVNWVAENVARPLVKSHQDALTEQVNATKEMKSAFVTFTERMSKDLDQIANDNNRNARAIESIQQAISRKPE